jgi:hypothetical protein
LLRFATVACAVLTASGLAAQTHSENDVRPHGPTGLVVGLNLTSSYATVDGGSFGDHTFTDRGREGGGGMHLTLGYNFTPAIGVLLHAGGILLNDDDERVLGGVDLALRYSLTGHSEAVIPYLEMAVGGYALEDETSGVGSELSGGTVSVAAGLNYFLTRRFALNADFRYNVGTFTTARVEGQSITHDATIGLSTSRVNVGFNWFPRSSQ